MQEMPQPNSWLSNEFDLCGSKDVSRSAHLLAKTRDGIRRHTTLETSSGLDDPVAELRGWERLLSGDRAARRVRDAGAAIRAGQKRRKMEHLGIASADAEGALFSGDRERALEETRQALNAIGTTSNLAVTLHGRRMLHALRLGRRPRGCAELVRGTATPIRVLGPAAITRDPAFCRSRWPVTRVGRRSSETGSGHTRGNQALL